MSARDLKQLLPFALDAVNREITANSNRGGLYARGMATEGYAGGYRDALYDVEAILRTISPGDHRHYWREARAALQVKARRSRT